MKRERKLIQMQFIFPQNVFDPQLVVSVDVELTDTGVGWGPSAL